MRIPIYILTLCFLFSCKKTGMNYVRGTVFESDTGNPINGATVYLHEHPRKKDNFILDSAISNERGEYKIEFFKKVGKKYYLSGKHSDYFEFQKSFNELEHGKTAFNLSLEPISYLRLRFVKNTPSANAVGGYVNVSGFSGNVGYEGQFNSPSPPGPYPDRIYFTYDTLCPTPLKISANRFHALAWSTFAATGPINEGAKNYFTFYTAKGDTVDYTISFD